MKKHGLITNYRELPYNPDLKEHARMMRNNSTKGEIKFWCELLRNKKSGYQFYRQKTILNYIVDFYCARLKLVIEIDGTSHLDKREYDKMRDNDLKTLGLKILRYDDLQVINNFEMIEKQFYIDINTRAKELEEIL
jgi:very-short-patch-repair endonuclease